MIKRQKNKLAMYGAVLTYISDNSSIYSDNDEFTAHKTSLSQTLDELRLKEDARNKATKGKVQEKIITRAAVTNQALAVAGALYAFAKKQGNQTLIESTKLTKSKLDRLRDVELIIELNSINDNANQNLAELTKYGITTSKLQSYFSNIDLYSRAIGAKDSGSAAKKGANRTLSTLFQDADDLIDSIDKLMESYRDSNGEFYTGYKGARVIKDLGTRHIEGEEPVAPQTQGENK